MTGVLADTSVWIAYLRPTGFEAVKKTLRSALVEGRVHTCWPIRAELLVGARDPSGYARLQDLIGSLAHVPVGGDLWDRAARLGFALRRQALTVPLPDLLIAQAAIDGELELWHLDTHYPAIAAASPLRARSFLPEG